MGQCPSLATCLAIFHHLAPRHEGLLRCGGVSAGRERGCVSGVIEWLPMLRPEPFVVVARGDD
jgi:hypothetical protein